MLNNPLKYTDPTGFEECFDFDPTACVGDGATEPYQFPNEDDPPDYYKIVEDKYNELLELLGRVPSPAELVAMTANAEYGIFRYIEAWRQDASEAIAREYLYFCGSGPCYMSLLADFLIQFQVWRDTVTDVKEFVGTVQEGYADFLVEAQIVYRIDPKEAYDLDRPWTFGNPSTGSSEYNALESRAYTSAGNFRVYDGTSGSNNVWLAIRYLGSDGVYVWAMIVTPNQKSTFCGGNCLN